MTIAEKLSANQGSHRYVINKSSRMPDAVCGSYMGPTWDRSGMRDKYKAFYEDKEEAESIAKELTNFNPGVGFEVSLV